MNNFFLFLLYINDLPNCLERTKARLFADDTTLTATGLNTDEVQTKLNYDLVNVNQWLKVNKLTLNEEKTEFMIIGSRQRVPSFIYLFILLRPQGQGHHNSLCQLLWARIT